MTKTQVSITALLQKIHSYVVDEQNDCILEATTQKLVYISYTDTVPLLLYLLYTSWGPSTCYELQGIEPGSTVVEDSSTITPDDALELYRLTNFLNESTILEYADELAGYGVYVGDIKYSKYSIKNRIVVVNSEALSSSDALLFALCANYTQLGMDYLGFTIQEIAPRYLYVSDLTSFSEQNRYVMLLPEYKCDTILLYSNRESYINDNAEVKLQKQLDTYSNVLKDHSYMVVTEDTWNLSEIIRHDKTVPFGPIDDLYNSILSANCEYFVMDIPSPPVSIIKTFALAYCTGGKVSGLDYKLKAIWSTPRANNIYHMTCAQFFSGDWGYFDFKLKCFEGQMFPGAIAVNLSNSAPTLVMLNKAEINLTFRVVELEPLISFIKPIGSAESTDFSIALDSDTWVYSMPTYTEKDFNPFEEIAGTRRHHIQNICDTIQRIVGKRTMSEVEYDNVCENYAHVLLRLLEQVLYKYKAIYRIQDVLVFMDTDTDTTYIGFAKMEPKCNANIIQMGNVSCVSRGVEIEPNLLDSTIIYDLDELIPRMLEAFADSNLGEDSALLTDFDVLDSRMIEMLKYSICWNPYRYNEQYRFLSSEKCSLMDMRLASSFTRLISTQLFQKIAAFVQSYGLRLLKRKDSPIDIFGSINFRGDRLSSGSGAVPIYLDALKCLPTRKGD